MEYTIEQIYGKDKAFTIKASSRGLIYMNELHDDNIRDLLSSFEERVVLYDIYKEYQKNAYIVDKELTDTDFRTLSQYQVKDFIPKHYFVALLFCEENHFDVVDLLTYRFYLSIVNVKYMSVKKRDLLLVHVKDTILDILNKSVACNEESPLNLILDSMTDDQIITDRGLKNFINQATKYGVTLKDIYFDTVNFRKFVDNSSGLGVGKLQNAIKIVREKTHHLLDLYKKNYEIIKRIPKEILRLSWGEVDINNNAELITLTSKLRQPVEIIMGLKLNPKEQMILESRLVSGTSLENVGLDKAIFPKTVTRERVRQIQKLAILDIKQYFDNENLLSNLITFYGIEFRVNYLNIPDLHKELLNQYLFDYYLCDLDLFIFDRILKARIGERLGEIKDYIGKNEFVPIDEIVGMITPLIDSEFDLENYLYNNSYKIINGYVSIKDNNKVNLLDLFVKMNYNDYFRINDTFNNRFLAFIRKNGFSNTNERNIKAYLERCQNILYVDTNQYIHIDNLSVDENLYQRLKKIIDDNPDEIITIDEYLLLTNEISMEYNLKKYLIYSLTRYLYSFNMDDSVEFGKGNTLKIFKNKDLKINQFDIVIRDVTEKGKVPIAHFIKNYKAFGLLTNNYFIKNSLLKIFYLDEYFYHIDHFELSETEIKNLFACKEVISFKSLHDTLLQHYGKNYLFKRGLYKEYRLLGIIISKILNYHYNYTFISSLDTVISYEDIIRTSFKDSKKFTYDDIKAKFELFGMSQIQFSWRVKDLLDRDVMREIDEHEYTLNENLYFEGNIMDQLNMVLKDLIEDNEFLVLDKQVLFKINRRCNNYFSNQYILREAISSLGEFKFIKRKIQFETLHREKIILKAESEIETFSDLSEYIYKNYQHSCNTKKAFFRYLKLNFGIFDNNVPKEILNNELLNEEFTGE